MTAERIFVGRKAELEQFKKVIEDPRGQAVLAVGQAGMGKTWLVNEQRGDSKNVPEQCVNLGCLCAEQGRTDYALDYWEKALELYGKIGMKPDIEKVQGLIEELNKDSGS